MEIFIERRTSPLHVSVFGFRAGRPTLEVVAAEWEIAVCETRMEIKAAFNSMQIDVVAEIRVKLRCECTHTLGFGSMRRITSERSPHCPMWRHPKDTIAKWITTRRYWHPLEMKLFCLTSWTSSTRERSCPLSAGVCGWERQPLGVL